MKGYNEYMSQACRLGKAEGPACTEDCIKDGVICPLVDAHRTPSP